MPVLTPNSINPSYRPDIDGLRAIAVLSVLFFHAGFSWAPGGYIGVDIFFVISGFLITGNILSSLEKGQFTLRNFYMRRIRRLMPALFFMIFLVWIVGFLLLAPSDFERIGKSIIYSVLSFSNFFFWSEAGYFDTSSELKPLLHTWSLAVEEQFYLVWPSLILGLSLLRNQKVTICSLLVIGSLSFYISQIFVEENPSSAFFLLPFRIFEFSIGALCVWALRKPIKNPWVEELFLAIGLILVIWPIYYFTQETPFPGTMALMPCAGAALIIYSGRASILGLLLSNKICVGIGLISYSTYLIHWPLIVYYKSWKFAEVTQPEKMIFIIASLVLGFLMWRFIENSFRYANKHHQLSKRSLTVIFLIAIGLVSLGALTISKQGWASRIPNAYRITFEDLKSQRLRYWQSIKNHHDALMKRPNSPNKIILMGDSHAIDLLYSLRKNNFNADITWLSTKGCYNFRMPVRKQLSDRCQNQTEENFSNPAWGNVDAIYLHESWPKEDFPNLKDFLSLARKSSTAPIYVFGPKMNFEKDIPSIVHSHMSKNTLNNYAQQFARKSSLKKHNEKLIQFFSVPSIADLDIHYVNTLAIQCGETLEACDIISRENYQLLYFDKDHFTEEGALEFGKKLKQAIPELFFRSQ